MYSKTQDATPAYISSDEEGIRPHIWLIAVSAIIFIAVLYWNFDPDNAKVAAERQTYTDGASTPMSELINDIDEQLK